MRPAVYLPPDDFGGTERPNLDLAADYLELSAAFSSDGYCFSEDIVDALELAAEAEFDDVHSEVEAREDVAAGAVARVASRRRVLEAAYPFAVDNKGDAITYTAKRLDLGQAAYLVCLILSNLRAVSPLLDGSDMHPSDEEVRALRQQFQYFATAAIAAEIGGPAWSFGYPRPDGTGFLKKLSEIWSVLKDGSVQADPASPTSPKDDQVDVFAWREQKDGLPGFLLVAAQVATGRNWKDKSIKSHVSRVFCARWFDRTPATEILAYHVVPFARADEVFRDDVLVLGNVLHRLRVPRRVAEAHHLVQGGMEVEAYDQLAAAAEWVMAYVERARLL